MDRFEIWSEIIATAEDDYDALSGEEKMLYSLKSILDAVNGSGLISYYESNAGGYVEDALETLYSLGLDEIAAVIESANSMFPETTPPTDINERLDCIAEWEGDYDDLFDEWTEEILEFSSSLEQEISKLFSND